MWVRAHASFAAMASAPLCTNEVIVDVSHFCCRDTTPTQPKLQNNANRSGHRSRTPASGIMFVHDQHEKGGASPPVTQRDVRPPEFPRALLAGAPVCVKT